MIIEGIKFSKPQQRVIRDICRIQLHSLERVINGDTDEDVTLVLAQHNTSYDEFIGQLETNIDSFEELKDDPTKLPKLDKNMISIFRHVLTHVEDGYKERYPKAISNLWKKLFLLEDLQKQLKNN